MSDQIKLIYFNSRARAELTRLVFALAGESYIDYRLAGMEEWKELKSSKKKQIKYFFLFFIWHGMKLLLFWIFPNCKTLKTKPLSVPNSLVKNIILFLLSHWSRNFWFLVVTFSGMPFDQLPVLVYQGEYLCQSMAIARFVAHKFGLGGNGNLEQAKVEMIVDAAYDLTNSK